MSPRLPISAAAAPFGCSYPNRSQAIQAALREKMERWKQTRLTEELAKLDPKSERTLAEEWLAGEKWAES